MFKNKQHIKLFFLIVFSFSLIYKHVHVLQHKSEDYQTICCSHKHKCESKTINNINLQDTFAENNNTDRCPICEYQFTINNLPKTSFFNIVIPVISFNYADITKQQQYKQTFSDKTPRAPPIYVS